MYNAHIYTSYFFINVNEKSLKKAFRVGLGGSLVGILYFSAKFNVTSLIRVIGDSCILGRVWKQGCGAGYGELMEGP